MIRLLAALLLSSTVSFASAPRLAVVPYQGLGAEPGVVERLAAALRAEVAGRKWDVVSADESERRERAAVMCGEDVECLGTVGQRLDARFVLAFGVGRVGQGVMVSALLVDTEASKKLAEFSERLTAIPADAGPLALRAVDVLLAGRSPPVKLVPAEVPPPVVLVEPVPPKHTLRPWAVGTAIGAGALAVGGGVLTGVAAGNFRALPEVAPQQRMNADAAQRGLNAAADVTVITAGVAAATAIVLFVIDAREGVVP
jgi:TolB-like protein